MIVKLQGGVTEVMREERHGRYRRLVRFSYPKCKGRSADCATSFRALKMWGISGRACTPNLSGVSGHTPCPNRRNALHSKPSFRRRYC